MKIAVDKPSVKEVTEVLRVALTGTLTGPPLGEIITVLGRDETRKRLQETMFYMNNMGVI
jgi:glutamyl/glutaminyl-tRNA synthetase